MLDWLTIVVIVGTLALMLIRPRGLSEAWFAAGGAIVTVAIGAVSLSGVRAVLSQTGNVLLFLLGMMVLTDLVERAGVFAWLAEGCARLARGSGILLFCNIFLLGAAVTALLSLDVTVIMLTPIVYALTLRRRLDPLPFMFACTFVANTSSLVFPMSNLTNLLVFARLQPGFFAFAGRMWLPNLVAVAVNLGLFLWLFRHRLPRRLEIPEDKALEPAGWWLLAAAGMLAATLCGLFVLGLLDLPLAWGALLGAGLLLGIGVASGRAQLRDVGREVSWPLFVFVVGMFIVVRGFTGAWLPRFESSLPTSPSAALLTGAIGGALGSNVVNNVPMVVFALSLLQRLSGPARQALAYGTLLGVNIGPTLTTYGSLATMLWLTIVRKRGLDVSSRDYMKIGVLTMPAVLAAATITLWFVL